MANARIVSNQTGHDRTGVRNWKWAQVREALTDATVRILFLTLCYSYNSHGRLIIFWVFESSFGLLD